MCGTVSSLTSWKRLWNYFFPTFFLHKIGWNWWTAVFAWIFLVKIRTQTWWKMLSTWEMHLFWAICLTRTLASIQRVQWIVGSCATLHFLMRRTWTCMNPHTKVPRGPGEQGFPHGWFFVDFFLLIYHCRSVAVSHHFCQGISQGLRRGHERLCTCRCILTRMCMTIRI